MGKIDFGAIRAAVEAEDNATDKRRKPPEEHTYFKWTQEMIDRLTALVDQQKTAEEISQELSIPLDKVQYKLTALKAKVPSATRTAKAIKSVPSGEGATKTPLLDKVVFHAFDELVLRLQADGEDPARTFRCALDMIELWAEGLQSQIDALPAAWPHFAAIGAMGTYQKITGKQIFIDDDGMEKAACGAGTP